jgi:hypothetical protein
MTTHSNGMSALQLEAQLGVTYKTAWLLTQKLRRSMIDPNRVCGLKPRRQGQPRAVHHGAGGERGLASAI